MTLRAVWLARAIARQKLTVNDRPFPLSPIVDSSGPKLDALGQLLGRPRFIGFSESRDSHYRLLLAQQTMLLTDTTNHANLFEYEVTLHSVAVALGDTPPGDKENLEKCRERLHRKAVMLWSRLKVEDRPVTI